MPQSNPFADLYVATESTKIEPSKQQQAVPQTATPKPQINEEKIHQMQEFRLQSQTNNPGVPPRQGPSLWWEKNPSDLHAITVWHRKYPMSPAFQVFSERDTNKDRPAPARTLTRAWYEDE